MEASDPFGLERFVQAQATTYEQALAEISRGEKRSHWMWFIFPQLRGLGHSPTARHYALRGPDEARAYLAHPLLGPRLVACASAALRVEGRTAADIFGTVDALKLRSCATLFACVAPPDSVFARLLARYYGGQPDGRTLELLGTSETG